MALVLLRNFASKLRPGRIPQRYQCLSNNNTLPIETILQVLGEVLARRELMLPYSNNGAVIERVAQLR